MWSPDETSSMRLLGGLGSVLRPEGSGGKRVAVAIGSEIGDGGRGEDAPLLGPSPGGGRCVVHRQAGGKRSLLGPELLQS